MFVQRLGHFIVVGEQRAEPHRQHGLRVEQALKDAVMIQYQSLGLFGILEFFFEGRAVAGGCYHADQRSQAVTDNDTDRIVFKPHE